MAGFYHSFVSTRGTYPDLTALRLTLFGQDPTIGLTQQDIKHYTIKKNSAWTSSDVSTSLNLINIAIPLTPQRQAQNEIDVWPIAQRALLLSLIDDLNFLRTSQGLPAITPAQAILAARNKAGTL